MLSLLHKIRIDSLQNKMSPVSRYVFICIGIVAFSLTFAHDAIACECLASPGPCAEFGRADAVFVGRVVGIKETTSKPIGTEFTAQFAVEQSFKGLSSTQKTVEVSTGGVFGECGYKFKAGQRYFVFADQSSGKLVTSICSYTQPAAGAEDDLELIDALVRDRRETRIFGRIDLIDEEVEAAPADMKFLNLAGMRVEARTGRSAVFGTTDAEGRYRIKNVPSGRYVVRLLGPLPSNLEMMQYAPERTVEIGLPASCGSRANFQTYAYGAIRGRVLDAAGRPVGNVDVSAVQESTGSGTRTRPDGTYEFPRMRAGRYVVSVASGQPAIVSIIRGATRSGVDIRLPVNK
jgi:hypothetical protein